MLTPQLSIIIPTYNRKDILLRTLKGYELQTARGEILEILVIDDGSTDGTGEAVEGFSATSSLKVRCLVQQNKGQAAARNYGIREAHGTLILLGDDDIIPAPTLVAEHISWNRKYPEDNFAILGHVSWSPEVNPTPFMEWMGLYKLFGYGFLVPGKEVGISCFYSCNMSLKRDFLLREGLFDENFRTYGFEDTELGYRLTKKGLHTLYNPEAIGYHLKRMSYADACRRQEMIYLAREYFDATEAGQFLRHQAPNAKREVLKHNLKMAVAKVVAPLLSPLTPVLDSHVQLPRVAYELLYSCVAMKAQASYKRSRSRHQEAKESIASNVR